jgi:hypothetical protein
MAKPKSFVDDAKLKMLMKMKPSLADTAAFLDVSEDTIYRYIKENYNQTFMEFRSAHMVKTRYDLVRTAVEKALAGDNVMLIFCLKNICHWADRVLETTEDNEEAKIKSMPTAELIKMVKEKVK